MLYGPFNGQGVGIRLAILCPTLDEEPVPLLPKVLKSCRFDDRDPALPRR